MNITEIVSNIDAEISRLQEVRALLAGHHVTFGRDGNRQETHDECRRPRPNRCRAEEALGRMEEGSKGC